MMFSPARDLRQQDVDQTPYVLKSIPHVRHDTLKPAHGPRLQRRLPETTLMDCVLLTPYKKYRKTGIYRLPTPARKPIGKENGGSAGPELKSSGTTREHGRTHNIVHHNKRSERQSGTSTPRPEKRRRLEGQPGPAAASTNSFEAPNTPRECTTILKEMFGAIDAAENSFLAEFSTSTSVRSLIEGLMRQLENEMLARKTAEQMYQAELRKRMELQALVDQIRCTFPGSPD